MVLCRLAGVLVDASPRCWRRPGWARLPPAACCAGTPEAARRLRAKFADDGWDAPVLDRIVEVIDRRAKTLADIASPPSAPPRKINR